MIVPGSNLLSLALRVSAPLTLGAARIRRYQGRATNAAGFDVPTYADSVDLPADTCAQPVPRNRYQMQGLDYAKDYITIYTTASCACTDRDTNGDVIEWDGRLWLCASKTAWRTVDGWEKVVCVEVPV